MMLGPLFGIKMMVKRELMAFWLSHALVWHKSDTYMGKSVQDSLSHTDKDF